MAIFLSDDAPGSELIFCGAHSSANSAARKFLQLVASRFWRHSCEGRIHNHEAAPHDFFG
jgi:hypothetical protein